jgi:hypothetical protein
VWNFLPALASLVLAVLPAAAQTAGEIYGDVTDARGGEALARVQVQLAGTPYQAVSSAAGRFTIAGIGPGDYILNVSTVGYHLTKHAFHLDAGESKEFHVVLASDTMRQTEIVQAKADPFETTRADSPDALTLAGNDVKNLGSVLADDCRAFPEWLRTTISKRAFRSAAPISAASGSMPTTCCCTPPFTCCKGKARLDRAPPLMAT